MCEQSFPNFLNLGGTEVIKAAKSYIPELSVFSQLMMNKDFLLTTANMERQQGSEFDEIHFNKIKYGKSIYPSIHL